MYRSQLCESDKLRILGPTTAFINCATENETSWCQENCDCSFDRMLILIHNSRFEKPLVIQSRIKFNIDNVNKFRSIEMF